jgi:hypothetical protein
MPGPLSETLKRMRSSSRSTLTPTTGGTPAVSQASKELSTSSFRQTPANSSCDTPTSAESWRASKYSAAREISKVVLCSLVISSSRRSSDDTDNGSDPKNPKGRDTPKDTPARLPTGFFGTTAAGQRFEPLDLFATLLVEGGVLEEDVPVQARVRVILVVGCCVQGIVGWRYAGDVHNPP